MCVSVWPLSASRLHGARSLKQAEQTGEEPPEESAEETAEERAMAAQPAGAGERAAAATLF